MATKKVLKKTTKKPQKKIVIKADDKKSIVEIKKQPSEDDLIVGKTEEIEVKTELNYEHPSRLYKVTNLVVKNNPVEVTGEFIETFIGSLNLDAREALKGGAKEVITKDYHGNNQFKIEVIK